LSIAYPTNTAKEIARFGGVTIISPIHFNISNNTMNTIGLLITNHPPANTKFKWT
jgi:hypothetical protein